MTTYAPVAPYADRSRHSRALVLIVAGHAALIAAVMMAKMDAVRPFIPTITKIDLIDETKPPPENPPPPQPRQTQQRIDQPIQVVQIPQPISDASPIQLPPILNPGPVIDPRPAQVNPPADPVRVGPRFATPEYDVKPPYPQSKLRSQEEAVLQLRLTIDARGRVTAVDPVGTADPVFLAAARKHILTHWRYRAATEDGRSVTSSTVITLRFQLDD
ncbi:MAG TPA: energy transducer TonB [Sphingomicrobium sp.]|nr:energy transducer TonB [Sphingomicrobium sp.]